MKACQYFRVIAIFLLLSTSGTAQSDNLQKILGCWELKSVTFKPSSEVSKETVQEGRGRVVCFRQDGTFSGHSPIKEERSITGTWSLSPDGKTLQQIENGTSKEQNLPAQVVLLSDSRLRLEIDFAFFEFSRK